MSVARPRPDWSGLIQAAGRVKPPVPDKDSLATLLAIRDAARGVRKLPPAAAAWLADGLDRFLAADGFSLDECFGLKPRRGGRHETPHALAYKAKRDRAIFQLAAQLTGSAWSKAGKLHEIINRPGPAPSKEAQEAIEDLAAQGIKLPGTQPALYQAIVSVTLSNRNIKK